MSRLTNQTIDGGVSVNNAVYLDTGVWYKAATPHIATGIYEGSNVVITNGSDVVVDSSLEITAKFVPVVDGVTSLPLSVTGTYDTLAQTTLSGEGVFDDLQPVDYAGSLRILYQNKKEVV
jgi:hypothetical protein